VERERVRSPAVGGYADVAQELHDERRLGDKRDNPHGVTTRGAFQRKNLINPGHQYGP
jgi:hypothetical protein